jgi:hypothetical protein
MRRKRLIGLALLPALLLAGDFVYWRLATSQLRSGFEVWAAQARASGWDVRHGALVTGGWPDAATLRVNDFAVSAPRAFGPGGVNIGGLHLTRLDWGSDAIILRSGLTQPYVLEVTPVRPHPIRLNDNGPIPVSVDHMRLRLTLRLNAPPRVVDLDAVSLAAEVPGFGPVSVGHLSLHSELHPDAGRDQPVISFSTSAQPVTLPDGVHWGLGPSIDEFALDGVLNGPLPSHGAELTAGATSWRDEGGSLELHRVVIDWGQVRLDATATLALDDELQPMGAGTAKIAGYGAALDALAANAVLTRSAAKAAKAVLSLLANTPAEGQPEEVEVPLTLQFRTLSVRQVPLIRLPELDWPAR